MLRSAVLSPSGSQLLVVVLRIDSRASTPNVLINYLFTLNNLITFDLNQVCGQYPTGGSGQYAQCQDVRFRGSSTGGRRRLMHSSFAQKQRAMPHTWNRRNTYNNSTGRGLTEYKAALAWGSFWNFLAHWTWFSSGFFCLTLHSTRKSLAIGTR